MDILLGPEAKPGLTRKLTTLFKNPHKIFYEVSNPVSLRQFLETPNIKEMSTDYQTLILRRNLLLQTQPAQTEYYRSHEKIHGGIERKHPDKRSSERLH